MVPRRSGASHEGHIHAGGIEKDVLVVETDDVNDEIDAAYRMKYDRFDGTLEPSRTSTGSPPEGGSVGALTRSAWDESL
jgi:hypothetical protein